MDMTGRRRFPGVALLCAGVVGIVTGAVPLVTSLLRLAGGRGIGSSPDIAGHGIDSMGLSLEWAMLSSAMGTCLGIILVWAGICWLRRNACAVAVTWAYVLFGIGVNAVDVTVFALRAEAGAMRSWMLVFDGIALLIPLGLGVWLLTTRREAGG